MRSLICGVITLQGTVASLTGQRGTRARGYANMISVVSVLLKPLNLNDLLCFFWDAQKCIGADKKEEGGFS